MRLDERRVMLFGGLDRRVAEQQAYGADVGAGFEQAASEGITEAVWVGVNPGNLAKARDHAPQFVYGGVELAGCPEEWLFRLWQRGKGISDAWMQQQADWDARFLSGSNSEVAIGDGLAPERRRVTDAQPGVDQQQYQGAGADPAEIDERVVIVRETITRREQGGSFLGGEGQCRQAGILGHSQAAGRVAFDPATVGGELEELTDDLQFSPAGGRCDLAGRAVSGERVQGYVGNRLRAVRLSQMAQCVRVLAQRRFGKPARLGIGEVGVRRRAHGHLRRKASINLAGFEKFDSVKSAVPGPGFKGAAVSTPRQFAIAPYRAGAALPADTIGSVGTGFQVAAVGLQHGADSIIRGTRFGTRRERTSECQ